VAIKSIYLDVETTGLTRKNGIIQLSGMIIIDGVEKEQFDFRVKPFENDEIEDKALEVSGTTREALQKEPYREPGEVYNDFVGILGKYVDKFKREDKFHFIAYNANFDDQRLRDFFSKIGDKYFGSWFFYPYLDVMTMAATVLAGERANMSNFRLNTVAKKLGINVDESRIHDAMYDIYLTRAIFCKIKVELR
jgi:DNA polymerase-3 subunit epsilon